jgi:hypothetical protein
MRLSSSSLFAIAALVLSSCVSIPLPDDFLTIVNEPGDFRAVTADEAKVWVRHFTARKGGSVDFWRDALKRDLVEHRGYLLLEESAGKDRKGRDARRLLFETQAGGRPHRYLLVVSAWPGWFGTEIRVVELVADKTVFDQYREEVEAAATPGG